MKACSRWIVSFGVFAFIALFAAPLAAQDARTLQVTVEDEVGGVLVSANVSLVNIATGQARDLVTSRQGVATFDGLARGEYKIVAGAPGFRTVERPISIGAGQPRPVRVQLGVEVTEVVMVEEFRTPPPGLENIEENADQVSLGDDVLTGIPLAIRGDRIVQFLSRFMNSAAGVPSIVIDGHEVTRLNLPPRAIDELVVNKNPYSAEYRRPGRARIEVVSQDGSESKHEGDATIVYNSSAVSARNPFVQEKPQIEEMVGELGFSGPIRGTKGAFLFAAELGGDRATAAINATTLNGQLTTFVPERQAERFYTGRIDLKPTDRIDFSVRYEYEQETERNGGVGGLILPELARSGDTTKQDVYITAAHIVSPGLEHVPSIHLSHESQREGNQPPNGPMLIVQGAFEGGVNQRYKQWEIFQADFVDIATWHKGRHVLRFGGRFTPSVTRMTDLNDFGGRYEFASLDMFRAGRPFVFTINDGNPRIKYNLHTADAHFQDEIKITPNFTFMAGIRYDWESLVEDRNNVAPRLAFSWAPGSKKSAIRGGAGIFYERLGGTAWEKVQLYGGDQIRSLVYNNPSYPDYRVGAELFAPTPTRFQLAQGLKSPYITQGGIGFDRQLTLESSFSVEYVHLRGSNLLRVRDVNTLIPGTGIRPNPNYHNMIEIEGTGRMKSNSIHTTFNGELGQFEGHVVYTYSRSYNDTPGSNSGGALSLTPPTNSFNPGLEWGRADFDRRHRFSVAGVYELPKDFEAGFVLDALSGLPYEITTGFDDNGDGIANDRPVGVFRNAGKQPKFIQLDMRLAKNWEVTPAGQTEDVAEFQLFMDVFNVFNTINYSDIVGVQSSPRFGLPSLAEKGRQLQAGFSFSF